MRNKNIIISNLVQDYLNGANTHRFSPFTKLITDNFLDGNRPTTIYDLMSTEQSPADKHIGSTYSRILAFLQTSVAHVIHNLPAFNETNASLNEMFELLSVLSMQSGEGECAVTSNPDYWGRFLVILDDDFYTHLATEKILLEDKVVPHNWSNDDLEIMLKGGEFGAGPIPPAPVEKKKIELSIKINGSDISLKEVRVLYHALKTHIEYLFGVGKEAVAIMEKFGFTNQYEDMQEFVLLMQESLDGLLEQKQTGKPLDQYIGSTEVNDRTRPDKVDANGVINLDGFTHDDYIKVLFTDYSGPGGQPFVQRILFQLLDMDISNDLSNHPYLGTTISKMVKDGVIEIGVGNEHYHQVLRLSTEFRALLSSYVSKSPKKYLAGSPEKVADYFMGQYVVGTKFGEFS